MNFLLEETATRSDGLSRKVDESFWTLSEKVDSLARDLSSQSQTELDALKRDLSAVASSVSDLRTALYGKLAHLESLQEASGVRITQAIQHHAESTRGHITGKLRTLDRESSAFRSHSLARTAKLENLATEALAVTRRCGIRFAQVDGMIFGVPAEEWRLQAYLRMRGVLEPGLMRLFHRTVKPGMVVVDIGANLGLFTVQAARLLEGKGRVHSFEPAPRIFQLLRDNVQVNGMLESGIVHFHECACAESAGTAKLRIFPDNSGHNTLYWPDDTLESVHVRTIALDMALEGESQVDLVKIDAEGAEPRILRGMVETIRRNPEIQIVLEFAPVHLKRAGEAPALFLQEIESLGLEIANVDDLSGELRKLTHRELLNVHSANLHLRRITTDGGTLHG